MSHYKPYPAYKDSGVEWLGKVPEHWTYFKVGRNAPFSIGWTPPTGDDASYGDDCPWVCISDMGSDFIDNTAKGLSTKALHAKGARPLPVGTLLFSFKLTVGSVSFLRVPAVTNEAIAAFPPMEAVDLRFFFYAAPQFIPKFGRENIYGSLLLNQELIQSAATYFPHKNEQKTIAFHLDRETAQIDALIAKKTRFIELLREKRQALITHAVTKGLDPSVKLKDSGVEWLGEVPEHWVICNVQHVVVKIEQGWSPDCLNMPAEDGQWGVVKSGCINGGFFTPEENKALPMHFSPIPEYEIKVGDVLMSRASGSPDLIGSIALVKKTPEKLMLSDKIFRLQCSDKILPSFFVMVMGARVVRVQVEQSISGADGLANNLPQSRIKKFVLPCPPIKEQLEIVSFMDAQIRRLQALSEKTERSIDLLKERRAALITAAVTGQIDLRETV